MRLFRTPRAAAQAAGFSLVELLVVVAIVLLLMGLLVGQIGGPLRGQRLTNAAETFRGRMEYARSWAISMNRPVEVRFVEFPSDAPGAPDSLGVAIVDPRDGAPAGRLLQPFLRPMPDVLPWRSGQWSSLWTTTMPVSGTMNVAGRTGLPYVGYTCFPDGSTDLIASAAEIWTLTFRGLGETREPPPNFSMVQVIPMTGRTRIWQP